MYYHLVRYLHLVNKGLASEFDKKIINLSKLTYLEGFGNLFRMLSSQGFLQFLSFAHSICMTKSSADSNLMVTPIEYPVCRVSDHR